MCTNCGGKSMKHERIMDLTAEIEGDIGTLEEVLGKFSCTKILDGEQKYKCNRLVLIGSLIFFLITSISLYCIDFLLINLVIKVKIL